mmetsp:Transcript_8312/g.24920  ORF Transcript_8312/g.24920 Transcript_8312/m.24920 type:complete len:139 (-) Transcript_8312:71-487(-)
MEAGGSGRPRLEDYLAVTEEVAQRRFKQKSTRAREASSGLATTKKKKAKKKLTLKKVLDNSGFDKLPPGKANWSNIEVGPSFTPKKKYSDISGLEAPYTDPKTKLRYANSVEYKQITSMPYELVQATLALRGANVVFR